MDTIQLGTMAEALGKVLPLPAHAAIEIRGLAYDSRQVKPGFLFLALPGQQRDGAEYIDDALQRGAVAVVGENALALRHVPYIQVSNAREAMARIAKLFFRNPSAGLNTFGITGTNGKTTTAFMLRNLLEAGSHSTGLISTIRYEIGERSIPANRTTPESPDLNAMLQKMDRAGCDSVVMEVSSHALDQHRVDGLDFDVAIFTNLTRDHLDYHENMEAYFSAKQKLFLQLGTGAKSGAAIINRDDPYGRRLHERLQAQRPDVPCWTYGLDPSADIYADDVVYDEQGTTCTVHSPWGSGPLRINMLGRFNVLNALAALAAAAIQGETMPDLLQRFASLTAVPGRLERCSPVNHPFRVFVDYAHTDDALAQVLHALRPTTAGRLITVFGCGGDRDTSKRTAMGALARDGADYAVITSDNPRSEDPNAIAAAIAAGHGDASRYEIVLDRASAIAHACALAEPGDTVVIAGKGHETYQEIGQTIIPFSDSEVARRLLEPGV